MDHVRCGSSSDSLYDASCLYDLFDSQGLTDELPTLGCKYLSYPDTSGLLIKLHHFFVCVRMVEACLTAQQHAQCHDRHLSRVRYRV